MFSNSKTSKLSSRGAIAIFLTVLILAALLAIALVIGAITLSEMRMSESARESTPGYFAAEAGIEKSLYNIRILGERPSPSETTPYLSESQCPSVLGGEGTCEVYITATNPDLIMKSIGEFMNIRRSIEITFSGAGW